MKTLVTEDFGLRLVEDLGMQYRTDKSKVKQRFALFECPKCFTSFRTQPPIVKANKVSHCKSCSSKTHGEHGTRLYNIWKNMNNRCGKHKNYMHVKVCSKWKDNFAPFSDWAMSNGYSEELTIDRVDSNLNYEPNNCRWATKEVQAQNIRNVYDGSSKYKGVTKRKSGKWVAQIGVRNIKYNIGTFSTEVEAANAYNDYILINNTSHTLNIIGEVNG